MKKRILFTILFSLVLIIGVNNIDAAPNEKSVIAKEKHNDNVEREKQTIDLKDIEHGSNIDNTFTIITLDDFIGDQCVILLSESHLDVIEISDIFTCELNNSVEIKTKGKHAIQTLIGNDQIELKVKSLSQDVIIPVISSNITLSVFYHTPTYYAQIENNIVINVIVADSSFIDNQVGTWLKTVDDNTIHGKFAGIGDTFNTEYDVFISEQPFNSWTLETINYTWQPPTPYPNDGLNYSWNEANQSWVLA